MAQKAAIFLIDNSISFEYNILAVYAGVAQLVEQLIRNQQVRCSSHPTSSSKPLEPQRF